jgi:hypothetical protein
VPDPTKTLMRSGYDYNDANYDSGNLLRVEPEGLSFSNARSHWVLLDAAGPGVLTSLWFTGKNRKGEAWIGGRLNFFFDGEPTPRLTGPLPGLLEDGRLLPKPLAEKSSGGWVSYAPLHFARALKVTLSHHEDAYTHRRNGRGETIPHLYHQFTYQRLAQPVVSTAAEDLTHLRSWQADERGLPATTNLALPSRQLTTIFSASDHGILNLLRLRFEGVATDEVRLQVVADEVPRIDLGVREFWGFSRTARPTARFQSLLLGVDAEGFYYCRFPMPHRHSLTVTLQNRGAAGRVHLETLHRQDWPEPEHYYFQAARVRDTTEKGRDLKLLETTGPGHYVGAILELANRTLEGDDRFYVDGEAFPPNWHGTGTEDYFRCGWYFYGGPLTRPLYGLLDQGQPKIAYRFHVADRVNFTRSVIIGFEHGHGNQYMGPYAGTVFWYCAR